MSRIAWQQLSARIACDSVVALAEAGSGHLGGSLSTAPIFAWLYGDLLRINPAEPDRMDRDRFVCSIGHVAPAYYAALANVGYFSRSELPTLRKLGSRLQGHPALAHHLPGLDTSSGSLGQGLSLGVGFALSARLKGLESDVYVLLGDGELQEGQIWEAAMCAAHHQLGNLVAIIDRNHVQIDGRNEDVMSLGDLNQKWRAFGWQLLQTRVEDLPETTGKLRSSRKISSPTVVIVENRMGLGVPEIEGQYQWHGRPPSPEKAESMCRAICEFYQQPYSICQLQ